MVEAPASEDRLFTTRRLIAAAVAAAVAALVFAVGLGFWSWGVKDVTMIVDGDAVELSTRASDVGSLLLERGLDLDETDMVHPSPDSALADGLLITVRRSVPVEVVLGDRPIALDVVGTTVADALIAAGVDPTAGIRVDPALETRLEPGLTVKVTDVFVRLVQKERKVEHGVVTVEDDTKPRGHREVRTKGEDGRVLEVYRVVVADGRSGEPILQAERTVTAPVDEVVVVGTRRSSPVAIAARGFDRLAEPPKGGHKMTVVATGYAPGSGGADHWTATGARATRGVIAVDPDVIPLGTRVYIPGYGEAVAADTGGAIKGARIDLCFDTRSEAIAWGRRTVTVTMIE